MKLVLKAADPAKKAAEVAIQYGLFFNTLLRFVIVAWVVFLLVKGVNAIRRRDAASPPKAPPAPTPQELLLSEIRDLLKDGRPAPKRPAPAKAALAKAAPGRRAAKK
jgi:large conductance mechanosensitive channel